MTISIVFRLCRGEFKMHTWISFSCRKCYISCVLIPRVICARNSYVHRFHCVLLWSLVRGAVVFKFNMNGVSRSLNGFPVLFRCLLRDSLHQNITGIDYSCALYRRRIRDPRRAVLPRSILNYDLMTPTSLRPYHHFARPVTSPAP